MPMQSPMSMWIKLPSERRRHLWWALAGISTSWLLAALMAYMNGMAPT